MQTKQKLQIGENFVKTAPLTAKTPKQTTAAPNTLLQSLIKQDNASLTQNGATTYKSTLSAVLDLFSMGAALRTRQGSEVVQLFVKALNEDALLTLKCLFNIRNVRGGAGERKTFRTILKFLGDNYPNLVKLNIDNIAFFGRYDDLYSLFGTKSENLALSYIQSQLNSDVENYNNDKSITLLAKWLPGENTTSNATRALGAKIRNFLGWTPKQYRKTLSALRSYSNVVEVKMSAGEWGNINYSAVPSKASLMYKDAFKKHDEVRYSAFIEAVKKGEVKINAGALFPHEIVAKVFQGDNSDVLDVLWDSLPNYLEDNSRNMLVVCDVSGSMTGTPMNVSLALGIYSAQHNKGPFGGYFITYSENPTLQKVVGANIREKVKCLQQTAAYSTNLQSVFDMVLKNAIQNNVDKDDMPAQIIVITDVEFNSTQNGNTNLDEARRKYAAAGYEMPCLVFWNVNSVQNNCPAKFDEKGVLLVSGASPSVFKTLLSGKQYTPVDHMLETLNAPQYDRVLV